MKSAVNIVTNGVTFRSIHTNVLAYAGEVTLYVIAVRSW